MLLSPPLLHLLVPVLVPLLLLLLHLLVELVLLLHLLVDPAYQQSVNRHRPLPSSFF